MDWRYKRSRVNIRVAYSSNKNARRRHAIDIFSRHKWYAFEEIVDFYNYWAAGFAAEESSAFAEDAEAVVSGACSDLLLFDGVAVDVFYDVK